MDDIKWAEPPPPRRNELNRRGHGRTQKFVAQLREHPGQWAQYQPDEPHWASNATHIKAIDPHVEAVVRKRPDGKYDVYARWVGNGDTP